MNREIYLDNAATAHVHPKVLQHLVGLYEKGIANSSSIHHAGVLANIELEKARAIIATKLNCVSDEIIFTSGATESNNLVLKGLTPPYKSGDEVIISSIEHSSISEVAKQFKELGVIVKTIGVDSSGIINNFELEKMITSKTRLVSIIHANNEIGVIQDLESIGRLCKEKNILFHSDGAQAFCKTLTDVKKMNLNFYSMSGHKIHAPKGIGALYINKENKLSPQLRGGNQEFGMRSGTVAVELASAMSEATKIYTPEIISTFNFLKNKLFTMLLEHCSDLRINGNLDSTLPNIVNFAIPGMSGKQLMRELDKCGIRVSVGSACNSGKKTVSHVLIAIGLDEVKATESIRVGMGVETRLDDIENLVFAIKNAVKLK